MQLIPFHYSVINIDGVFQCTCFDLFTADYRSRCVYLHTCAFVYLWCGFVSRAVISSEEEKHEQVNPVLAGLHHHMEVCQPLVALDTRYHMSLV